VEEEEEEGIWEEGEGTRTRTLGVYKEHGLDHFLKPLKPW